MAAWFKWPNSICWHQGDQTGLCDYSKVHPMWHVTIALVCGPKRGGAGVCPLGGGGAE